MSNEKDNGGRITTRQYYAELQTQTQELTTLRVEHTKEIGGIKLEMSAMELRIVEKINATITDGITAQLEYQKSADAKLAEDNIRLGVLEGDVVQLETWDKRIGILSAIGAILSGIIGVDRFR